MIVIKTASELKLMKTAGRISQRALRLAGEGVDLRTPYLYEQIKKVPPQYLEMDINRKDVCNEKV